MVNQNDKIMKILLIGFGFCIYVLIGRILINRLEEIDIVPLVLDGSWRFFTQLFWPVFICWNLLCKLGDKISDNF